MKISLRARFKSIKSFDEVDAPEFVVLTGVNGAGKSHLLEAIEKRSVAINGGTESKVVRFDFQTFRLENEQSIDARSIHQEAAQAWKFFHKQVQSRPGVWKNALGDRHEALVAQCRLKCIALWDCAELPPKYRDLVNAIFGGRAINLMPMDNPYGVAIMAVIKDLPCCVDEVTEEDFMMRYKPFATKNDFLPAAIGKVFWDYHIKHEGNAYSKFRNKEYKDNLSVLTEEEFIDRHGEKPWDFLNKTLDSFKTLNYRLNSPEGMDRNGVFALELINMEDPGVKIGFADLSSGERVLMALAASIYKTKADRHFPDVLLLDEIDASLHPSMIRGMLDVIQSVFLANNVKVILVTHSPTTIALCPEESVYVMDRAASGSRIEKMDKRAALSILTEGFATLDDGIRLFDQAAPDKVNILTEGRNTAYLGKVLEFEQLEDKVKIIDGLQSLTGKTQLKTLFDFFAHAEHRSKVLFVWDCDGTDVAGKLIEKNHTYPFIFEKNTENGLVGKGIENLFPRHLFGGYLKTLVDSKGKIEQFFDDKSKHEFECHVLANGKIEDFAKFRPLIDKIRELSGTGAAH